jgi:hypothetical protein
VSAVDASEQLRHSSADLERLAKLAGMDRSPWARFTRKRWMSSVRGYEQIGIQPYLWLRSTAIERAA